MANGQADEDKGRGQGLTENNWDTLLRRIKTGDCTPFLGAGINSGILPLGSEIAEAWAKEHGYPLDNCSDLAQVAQYLAISRDGLFPKEEILKLLKDKIKEWEKKVNSDDFFKAPDEPLSILADFPLPVYMTTNYDDLLIRALKAKNKDPKRELCRWNKHVEEVPSVFDSAAGFNPSPANPVVFHLHGHDEVAESLVLAEDDYIDFLVNISREQKLLPPRIQRSLSGASLIFVGYSLADLDFRVIFRGLVESLKGSLRRRSVAVQLPREDLEEDRWAAQKKYLEKYFDEIEFSVYWGTAKQFTKELRDRWERSNK